MRSGRTKGQRRLWVRDPDGFAPYDGPRVCHSFSGRWRPQHTLDKDGICIICGANRDHPPARAFMKKKDRGRLRWVAQQDQYTCQACADQHGRSTIQPPHPFCENKNGCRCRLEECNDHQ